MPYKVAKEEGKYVVYKKKKDGTKGDRIGATAGNKEALRKYLAVLHIKAKDEGVSTLWEDASSDIQDLIANITGYPEFVSKLGDLAKDPKVQAFLRAGKGDGSDSDDKLTITAKVIPVKDLFPTQNEIDIQGSLAWPLTNTTSTQNILKKGPVTIKAPAVTYNGKYIIDGHHRWSALYCMNVDGLLNCYDIKGPKMDPLDVLKIVQLAIAADTGEVPTASVKGINLLKASDKDIKAYILKYTKPECLDIFNKMLSARFGKLNNESLADKVIIPNVKQMQQKNKPVPGAPNRNVMPQTDDAPNALKMINKGVVNFNKPYQLEYLRKAIKKFILKEIKNRKIK